MPAGYTVGIDVFMVCVSIFGHVCNGPRKLRRYIYERLLLKHLNGLTTCRELRMR